MPEPFYENAGSLISPGDIFDELPYHRVPKPLMVARKPAFSLPKSYRIAGELREVFEVGKHTPLTPLNFNPPGEEILSNAKMAKAIFLTWGSEVEDDERRGKLHKKDWLIAPVFPLWDLENYRAPESGGADQVSLADAIRACKSPRYFPLMPFPNGNRGDYYVDFRKICPLAASHFTGLRRHWRLAPKALNGFYHQLMWFFTRKRIFLEPVRCDTCGSEVDLGVVFEGQPVNGEDAG